MCALQLSDYPSRRGPADRLPGVRIGVLTGGGDCPGLNAAIRAIVRKGIDVYGHVIVGFRDGWKGPLESEYDELIAIGGEDTLGAASRLYSEHGFSVLGVPKTIDNDLAATDVTFGYDTALQVATEAIDRLHTTAESHHRVMVVEVMGRHAGWIALHSGLAGGADVILIPEIPYDIDDVCRLIRRRHARGRFFSIVVVAEGAVPLEGTM